MLSFSICTTESHTYINTFLFFLVDVDNKVETSIKNPEIRVSQSVSHKRKSQDDDDKDYDDSQFITPSSRPALRIKTSRKDIDRGARKRVNRDSISSSSNMTYLEPITPLETPISASFQHAKTESKYYPVRHSRDYLPSPLDCDATCTTVPPTNRPSSLTPCEKSVKNLRPTLSYLELIVEAIKNSPYGMLSLQEIYDYIQDRYLYFRYTTSVSFTI